MGELQWRTSADLVSTYIEDLESPNVLTLRRAARNLGSLPRSFICGKLQQILESLQRILEEEVDDEVNFTEARRDAVTAMAQVCLTAGVQANGSPDSFVCEENVEDLYRALVNSMDDYHGSTCQQGQLRGQGGRVKGSSIPFDPSWRRAWDWPKPGRTFDGEKQWRMPSDATASLNWNNPSKVIPYITQMLRLPEYRNHILLGFTGSVEGHLQSMVAELLLPHLIDCYAHEQLSMLAMGQTLLSIFRAHDRNNRVTIGFLKMLQETLSSGYLDLDTQEHCQFCEDILDLCLSGLKNASEFQKLHSYINIICELFRFPGEVRKKVLDTLQDLLSHHIREVRMITAVRQRKMLMMHPVFKETVLVEALNLLLMTDF